MNFICPQERKIVIYHILNMCKLGYNIQLLSHVGCQAKLYIISLVESGSVTTA